MIAKNSGLSSRTNHYRCYPTKTKAVARLVRREPELSFAFWSIATSCYVPVRCEMVLLTRVPVAVLAS